MGREIKRVAADFDWPLEKVWVGFVNPWYNACHKCVDCDGTGYSSGAKHLHNQWYGNAVFRPEDRGSVPFNPSHRVITDKARRNLEAAPWYYGHGSEALQKEARSLADLFNGAWCHHLNDADVSALVKADRLRDFTHTWSREHGWVAKDPPIAPTAQQVNEWSLQGMAHDSCNAYACIEAECDRIGIEPACRECEGEGSRWESERAKQQADDWIQQEPPAGDGFQLWETVSEGSPISPVFKTPEVLADWLAGGGARGLDKGTTREQWLKFINGPGWAPTAIMDSTGWHTGVEACK